MAIRSAALGLALLTAAATSIAVAEDQPAPQSAAAEQPQWTEFRSAERGFAVSARLHQQLDHRNVLEVADVRDLHFDHRHHMAPRGGQSTMRRKSASSDAK